MRSTDVRVEPSRVAARAARLVFVLATVAGMAAQVPGLVGADWSLFDTRIYLDGGHTVFHDPSALYTTKWQGGWLFTYPPFAAVLFALLDVPPESLATALIVMGGVVALARISLLVARGVVDRLPFAAAGLAGSDVRRALTFGAATAVLLLSLLSEPVRGTIGFGQINLLLAWLVVEDFCRLGAGRGVAGSRMRGVLIGVAAGIKITPALLVIPLLLAGDWRAARNALLAGVATLAVSAAAVPQQTWDYFTRHLWDTERPGDPWYAWNQSLTGTVARLTGESGSPVSRLVVMAIAAVIGVLVVTCALRVGDQVAAVLLGWLTINLVSPISWYHHLVLVPALLVWLASVDHRWSPVFRLMLRVEAVVLTLSVIPGLYRLVPSGDGVEFSHTFWQFLLTESFPLTGLVLLMTLGGAMLADDPGADNGPTSGFRRPGGRFSRTRARATASP